MPSGTSAGRLSSRLRAREALWFCTAHGFPASCVPVALSPQAALERPVLQSCGRPTPGDEGGWHRLPSLSLYLRRSPRSHRSQEPPPRLREEARPCVRRPAPYPRVTRRAGRARRGPARGVQGEGPREAPPAGKRERAWLPGGSGGRAPVPPPSAAASARQNQTPGPAGWRTCCRRELSLRVSSRSAVARAPVATSQPPCLRSGPPRDQNGHPTEEELPISRDRL